MKKLLAILMTMELIAPLAVMADVVTPTAPRSGYAQYGSADLLVHLDAIENAGTGEHSSSPTSWTDLTGNITLTKTGTAGFSTDAWIANGSSCFSASSLAVKEALLARSFTLEMVISHPSDCNDYEYWAFLGTGSNRQLALDLRPKDKCTTPLIPLVQAVQHRESKWNNRSVVTDGTMTQWNSRQYIAVVCDSTGATTYCDGVQIHHTDGGGTTPSSDAVRISANASNANMLKSGAEICAVRMTARVLSAEEMERNRYVDSQRFSLSSSPDGYRFVNGVLQVRVAADASGFEFSVDGGTTWTTGEVWVPIGESTTVYARYVADRSAAVLFDALPDGAIVSGNSVMLTPTSPCTMSLSATAPRSSYVQYGSADLLVHLDAIENSGTGEHASSLATTWANLAGNATLSVWSSNGGVADFSGDAWVADGNSCFYGSSDDVKTALADKAFTLEMVISHPSDCNDYEYWAFFGTGSNRQLALDLRPKDKCTTPLIPLVQAVQHRESKWNNRSVVTDGTMTQWNSRQYIAVVCDSTGATTYCDGVQIHHTDGGGTTPSSDAVRISANASNANMLKSGAEICAVRMTARALSAEEMERNRYVDSQRFSLPSSPDGYRFVNGVLQVRVTRGVAGFEFSTDGGTTWNEGDVWTPIDDEVTLSARYVADPTAAVKLDALPDDAIVSGNSATFTPSRPYEITTGVPTLNAIGSAVWSEAAWRLGDASCEAPVSGDAAVSLSGDAALTLDGDVALDNLAIDGDGTLVIFKGSHAFSVAMVDKASGVKYVVCEGPGDTTAVWVGGASGDFGTASSWLGNTVPQTGWRVVLVNDTAATLNNDIVEFSPSCIEFPSGSAQVTVTGNAITNLLSVRNYAAEHHVFSNAVAFADGEVADILAASSSGNYVVWDGGMTMYMPPKDPAAGSSRSEDTAIWIAGDVTITADIPDWSTGESIGFLRQINHGTLTISHSVTVCGVPNFFVGENTTLNIQGDMILNRPAETADTRAYFSNYIGGMMIIDGWAINAGAAKSRFSEQENGLGWIKAYGLKITGTAEEFTLNGGDDTGEAGRWIIGAGGVPLGTLIWVQVAKSAYIEASDDFTIEGALRLSEGTNKKRHPKLYINPNGHMVTLAPESFDGNTPNASIIIQGNGTVKVLADVTPATGFQCNGTATIAVKPGVSLGSGIVSVASGATFEVAESGTVTHGGNMALADGAALGFNFTKRSAIPVLALASGKTLTASGAVEVKISGSVRPGGGEIVLTTCGGFDAEGVSVALASGAPEWVTGLSVNADGNIVLSVRPTGAVLVVR